MNILVLTSTFPGDKDDLIQHPFQLDFITLLGREGHRVTVLTQAKKDKHEKVRDDLDIIWFPWKRVEGRLAEQSLLKGGNIFSFFSLIFNGVQYARRLIDQNKIELAICLWAIPSGLYLYINSLLGMTKAPYLVWALGSDINKYRRNVFMRYLLKKIILRSAYVFADGFELCDTVSAISGRNCGFLPTFRRITVLRENRQDAGKHHVSFLYVGRHSTIKGIDVLINALALLEETNPRLDHHVTIAGEGELTGEMQHIVSERKLAHRVRFAGKVSDSDLFTLYAKVDCVVIPSRSESIPVVFSEALQLSKPMIVTDVGAMGSLGRKYGVAKVVKSGDPELLAKAMEEFITKPFGVAPEKRDELLSVLMMENSVQKILQTIAVLEAR